MKADEAIHTVLDLSAGMTRPVFRGHANANWALYSGAVRRVVKAYGEKLLSRVPLLQEVVREYHQNELLLPMETMEGKGSTDLQKLSTLQHFGAGTGLLDFTESALVALWFACQQDDDEPNANGAVFAVDIGNHNVATNGRLLADPLDLGALPREPVCYYEPDRSLGARVVAQQSVFLIGNPLIPHEYTRKCEIPATVKEGMIQSLRQMGLSRRALFSDVPGLAAMNSTTVPLAKLLPRAPRQQKELGDLAYQERRFNEALLAYQAFAASNPESAEAHCLLGDTFSALGRYEESVAAYTEAERHVDTPVVVGRASPSLVGLPKLRTILYNRGNACAALGNHADAVADFGKALEVVEPMGLSSASVQYNRANSRFELGEYAEAFEDYQAVEPAIDSSNALFGMGNCRVMLGQFDSALECFERGASEGGSESEACQVNANQTRKVLAVVDGHNFDVVRRGRNLDVRVKSLSGRTGELVVYAGHKGNVGNSPSTFRAAPGGKGYGGVSGFVVLLVEKGGSTHDT